MYRPGTGYTALYSCFNNYRLHSLVQLLQQLVIECTDQVPATQPCIVVSTTTAYTALYSCFNNWLQSVPTGYRLHSNVNLTRPNRLQSHPTQSIQLCVDSGAGRQLVSTRYGFNRPVTGPSWLLPTSTKNHQPTDLSISWQLLISSLFTGLRLMTGLIMCSP